jgi:thymidylate synthase (FAD)
MGKKEANMLDTYYKVLDDGFIALKGVFGSDETIEQAARVSYGAGTRKTSETRDLIRYLIRHEHASPTEMGEMMFHVRMPIYVMRQWIRHRAFNVNEYSGRYSVMIDSMEQTDPYKWRDQSVVNKQGSGDFINYHDTDGKGVCGRDLSDEERELHEHINNVYKSRLDKGVAREQARKDLPVSNYTECYFKCDIRNLLHFLGLRCDSHAQIEIRTYANIIASMVQEYFPLTFEAWYDYKFTAKTLTRLDQLIIPEVAQLLSKNNCPFEHKYMVQYDSQIMIIASRAGMSKRERMEFLDKFYFGSLPSFDKPTELYTVKGEYRANELNN